MQDPPTPRLALLRGDPSDGLPGVPGVGEKTAATLLAQHGSLEGILAAAHDPKSKMSKAYRTKLLAATDYIEAAGPVVRVATDADVNFSTPSDTLPLAAEHPRKVVKLAEQYGVTSSIGRLQKALDGARYRGGNWMLSPRACHRVYPSLQGHRPADLRCRLSSWNVTVTWRLVPSMLTLAVEGVTLLHRGALAVVALDVLDVLGAVAVGLVGEDLLHTGLRGADVQLGGDEEARLPEAQHQHHGHDDARPAGRSRRRRRPVSASSPPRRPARRTAYCRILAVLARLLAVLTRLLTVLAPAAAHTCWPAAGRTWPGLDSY